MTRILAFTRSSSDRAADPTTLARRGEMLSLFLVVCAVIVASKGFVGRQLGASPDSFEAFIYHPNPLVFALRVLCCCLEDVAVGLCCLLVGFGLLGLASSARSRGLVRVLAYASAILAVAFQVANMKLFQERREFLRLDLFWLVGGFSPYPGVIESVSAMAWCAMILGPIVLVALHGLGLWAFPSFWRAAASRVCRPSRIIAAVFVLALAIPVTRAYLGAERSDLARNPHLVFAHSWLQRPLRIDGHDVGGGADPVPVPGRPGDAGRRLARPPRNIILIVGEAVSTRFFESYGCPLPTTPNLRRLASRSLTFDNYYATTNYSFGSSMAIFGGIYGSPLAHSIFDDNPGFVLPSGASHLQGLGYETYFFGAGGKAIWDYKNTTALFCTRGFDVSRDPTAPFWHEGGHPSAFEEPGYGDEEMFADVRRAVRRPHSRPFALLIWAYDTHPAFRDGDGPEHWAEEHLPVAVRNGQIPESKFRMYLKAIWRLDRFVGRLCEDLEAQGLAEDTLIALIGDHGQSFGDHGLMTHATGLYEDQVHVPLILINPRLGVLGMRNAAVGGHIDLWPTIADLCSLPPHPQWQGRSLVSGDAENRRAYFYGARSGTCGVREGRWKYFWDKRWDEHFLFDVQADPGELDNLADAKPIVRDRLNRKVKSWIAAQDRVCRKN